jgi:hypothetical protein
MAFTGDLVTAVATNSFTEASGGSTGSTSYVSVGSICGIAFVAPASGRVMVFFASALFNSGANDNKCTVQVNNGGVVGAGSTFRAPVDNDMILFQGAVAERGMSFADVSGMIAGNTYNAFVVNKAGAGTTTSLYRSISVVPTI